MTPAPSLDFWLRTAAALGLVGVHATFWMRVHPANKAWLEGTRMTGAASRFFRTQSVAAAPTEWTELRRKWETGHLVRAVHAAAGVVALVVALA